MKDNVNKIILDDNRILAYSEFGKSSGNPVIYFHGFPASRLEARKFDQIANLYNYRLIAIDRPGMGFSTINKNRTILSTIADLVKLIDYLGIQKFSVIGYSGGGPYAAACAYLIPERLNNVTIISGMAPFEDPKSHAGMMREQLIACKLMKLFPFLTFPLMYINKMILSKSGKLLEKMIKPLPGVDREIFRDPVIGKELINSSLEAFRMGAAGPAYEMKLLLSPWGFKLEDIVFPVTICHGAKDTQVKIIHGEIYARSLPNSTFKVFEYDGHHSLIKNHFAEIVRML